MDLITGKLDFGPIGKSFNFCEDDKDDFIVNSITRADRIEELGSPNTIAFLLEDKQSIVLRKIPNPESFLGDYNIFSPDHEEIQGYMLSATVDYFSISGGCNKFKLWYIA